MMMYRGVQKWAWGRTHRLLDRLRAEGKLPPQPSELAEGNGRADAAASPVTLHSLSDEEQAEFEASREKWRAMRSRRQELIKKIDGGKRR